MRIILYTGKGGVGKTSIAAASAVKSAGHGKKTLVVSTDAAHSLGDCLDVALSPEPLEIRPDLWAQEINSSHEVEKSWGRVQRYLTSLFHRQIQRVDKAGDEYVFSIYMPFVEKKDIALNQKGGEVIVKAGAVKRNITVPRALAHLSVLGARFEDATLKIRFGGKTSPS